MDRHKGSSESNIDPAHSAIPLFAWLIGCDAFSCDASVNQVQSWLAAGEGESVGSCRRCPCRNASDFPWHNRRQEGHKRPITPHIVIRPSFMLCPTGDRPAVSAMSPGQGNRCWERRTQNAVACDFVIQRQSRCGIIPRVRQARRSSTDPYLWSRPVT
ncbi:hypothetical protein ABIC60_003791 [Phyllobacterium ifriqiyense]